MKNICSLISPFINHNSIAKSGRTIISALYSMNANFTITDISDKFYNLPTEKERHLIRLMNDLMAKELSMDKNIVFNSDLESIRQATFPYGFIPYFSVRTNNIPKEYIDMLVDKRLILVYNNFTKNILLTCGVKEEHIRVVSPSINPRMYMKSSSFKINKKKTFAFLSAIDISEDYGWTGMIRAFYNSFSQEDDVCLVLKANNRIYSKYYQLEIARMIDFEKKAYNKKLPPIILIIDSLTDMEMASLYSTCDCYVKISGVNTGLSFIEAFASGLICIGPETGGCREILNRDTGFMVKKKGEKRIVNNTLYDGITYDLYDEEHLGEIMQWIFHNSDKVKEKTVKERKIVLSKFDCNVSGQTFLKSLR